MKAVVCTEFGPPEKLVIQDLPSPQPGAGEAVVSVRAAALNFFDTLIIEGKYQVRAEPPFSPVGELAGVVKSVGAGVSGVEPGDRVACAVGYGAAREEVVVRADRLVGVPDAVSDEIAASLFVTYGTSLHALKDRGRLQPGETLAVLGASGGVGISAIEIAKVMGARVIACASSADKLAFCRERGADETVDYAKEDLKERLKELTGGRGVDLVYDPVGGKFTEAALRATGWGGRYLVIGFAAGDIPRIPLNLILLKGSALVGVYWGSFCDHDPAAARANDEQILAWVAEGKLKPYVDKVYPLAETASAIRALADRAVMGKVVIKP